MAKPQKLHYVSDKAEIHITIKHKSAVKARVLKFAMKQLLGEQGYIQVK